MPLACVSEGVKSLANHECHAAVEARTQLRICGSVRDSPCRASIRLPESCSPLACQRQILQDHQVIKPVRDVVQVVRGQREQHAKRLARSRRIATITKWVRF